jgi:S-adenosylmethionine-diacylgycerolhomoserine-N-methlytransferase
LAKFKPYFPQKKNEAMSDEHQTKTAQPMAMRHYYRWHARIYDATRWAFLFGRHALLKKLFINDLAEKNLLEIGCGTGHNLRWLAQNRPNWGLAGVDVSPDMLAQAAKAAPRATLVERAYGTAGWLPPCVPDGVLFSYALTMFNPGWEAAIERAWADLPAGGRIAVVDFHDTPSSAFGWWMRQNHVRMEGHLLPFLQAHFHTEQLEVRPAWLGLWRYFLFVGVKM